MYHPFSIAETVKTSWDILKKNFVTIIIYSTIAFFLLFVLSVVVGLLFSQSSFAAEMIGSFILVFVQAFSTLGLYKLIFTLIDSEYYEFEFAQVVPTIRMILSYLAVVFIIAIFITTFKTGLDRLIDFESIEWAVEAFGVIVGLYLTLRIMFFNTFIVDDGSGPLESLRQAFALTRDHLLKVLTILGIIVLLIALPAKISQYFPLFSLTIIFTYPFVNIILIVTYRKLVYSRQDVDDNIAETM